MDVLSPRQQRLAHLSEKLRRELGPAVVGTGPAEHSRPLRTGDVGGGGRDGSARLAAPAQPDTGSPCVGDDNRRAGGLEIPVYYHVVVRAEEEDRRERCRRQTGHHHKQVRK